MFKQSTKTGINGRLVGEGVKSLVTNIKLRFVAKKENVHSKALQKGVQLAFLSKLEQKGQATMLR